MNTREKDEAVFRGTKRKEPGDEAKSLFAQRLAASRRTVKHVKLDLEVPEIQSVPNDVSKGAGEAQKNLDLRKEDERFKSLYAEPLDFSLLGERDENFRACLKGKHNLDFSDPKSVMQLTKTILKQHFGLEVELPEDRLCPPVPNRHNYVLWLKDLLDSSSSTYADTYEPERNVTGLDIGTGASAIYPLLGCVQRPWSFIATDIDPKSLSYARRNIEKNELGPRVQVVERSEKDPMIPLDELNLTHIDFVMTNPPFYSSDSELLELAKQKSQPPNSACTGAPNEMVCDGGEVGFSKRILKESLVLQDRVQWYTTMVGKRTSLDTIVDLLKEHKINNYAVTEFIQGSKTRRWAVGWSYSNRRPNASAARGCDSTAGKNILPLMTEYTAASKSVRSGAGKNLENVFWTQLEDVTDGLDLVSWNLDEDRLRVTGFANENVWSRAYRRSKERDRPTLQSTKEGNGDAKPVAECAFGFSITIRTQETDKDTVSVVVRWLQGTDHTLFESFCGMLRNALVKVA
ncbi:hypothetical protein BX600DRAFT_392618 [Xylariales sp. PMI_506]|nr:hypothetical protein BX600DRAFT_392618 [Xylariales sp. PMI_506]